MCGIAGLFGYDNRGAISAMVDLLVKRGPDDRGVYRHGMACLGHTRLSIIDPSSLGHQPMGNAEGTVWIVYNGEMYNFLTERSELEALGHKFVSKTDTEVILALYERYGDTCVERMRGMFAFGIYDRRAGEGRERLLLARDHFGIKPLFYNHAKGHFAFASDPRAFTAAGIVAPELDPDAVRQFLMRGAVYQPRTILKNVFALEPGHSLAVTRDGIDKRCFWRPEPARLPALATKKRGELGQLLEAELSRVVEQQLIADVPLGAFLSGGLDSSLLVALMARRGAGPVRTFSVGFGIEGSELDETEDALLVANYLGTQHERLEVNSSLFAVELPAFIAGLGQPTVDGFNSYMVSKAAAQHVKVAISGTGADEIFAGYPWFASMKTLSSRRGARLSDRFHTFERQLRRAGLATGNVARLFPEGFVSRYASEYRHFSPGQVADLLGIRAASAALSDNDDLAAVDYLMDANVLDRTSAICLAGYTGNQLLRDIDSTSMAHSLEVRVPYLDPAIVDFALSLPADARLGAPDPSAAAGSYRGSGTKQILVDIAARLLPPEVTGRSKRGFSMPIDVWLKGPLRPLMESTIRNLSPAVTRIVNQTAASRVLDRFMRNQCHWGQPWMLMVLELWSRDLVATKTNVSVERAIA